MQRLLAKKNPTICVFYHQIYSTLNVFIRVDCKNKGCSAITEGLRPQGSRPLPWYYPTPSPKPKLLFNPWAFPPGNLLRWCSAPSNCSSKGILPHVPPLSRPGLQASTPDLPPRRFQHPCKNGLRQRLDKTCHCNTVQRS